LDPNWPSKEDPQQAGNFTKKFISMNWRYTIRGHVIASYLSQLSSNISWYYKGDIDLIFFQDGYIDSEKWNNSNREQVQRFYEGLAFLNANSPINLDFSIKEPTLINDTTVDVCYPQVFFNEHPNDPKSQIKKERVEKFYNDSFCDIVTESRFAQPTGNYSEKTYQPMYYMKPFVLVAPPKTLQYIKENGFKTFSDFWDESYDDCLNHHDRMLKIIDTIDYINSKSMDELSAMYKDMLPILEHNYNLFREKISKAS
jgi:hypothetical protein